MGFHKTSATRNMRTRRAHLDRCEDGSIIARYIDFAYCFIGERKGTLTLKGKETNSTELTLLDVTSIARHFFELGMLVSNPITAADRGMVEEIIINLKRVEQDYHIDLTKEMEWVRNKVRKGE